MEHPSELQQPQRPNKPGAMAPGISGHSRAGGRMTSGSLGEPSLMEGGAGDGSSWFEQVTHEEARKAPAKGKEPTLISRHLAATSPSDLRRPGRR